MEVWLDLEDTIINSWSDGLLINYEKIKTWLDTNNIGNINIWSFAIWDDTDIEYFETSGMKACIERVLDRKILAYPSVEMMQKFVFTYESIHYSSREEFMQLNSKKWSFIKTILGRYNNGPQHVVLIDDAVPTMDIIDHNNDVKIQLINIVDIKKVY